MDREDLLEAIWNEQDKAYELMNEYDSLPHHYGKYILYQAEAYIIRMIGYYTDINTTELADVLKKTPSACSQIVKKLVDKGLVTQIRNNENKRIYNLRLTSEGMEVFHDHERFNKGCQEKTFQKLNQYSENELQIYLKVQKSINEAYENDVMRSKNYYG